MRRKLISVCLIAWILFMMPTTAFAQRYDADREGSVSLTLLAREGKTPITGAEQSLYYVATVELNDQKELIYTFTDDFEDCGAALEDPDLAVKLDAFVAAHSVPAEKLVTDTRGKVKFADLPQGLYFVKQTNMVPGYAPCRSFLVTIPNKTANGYVFDVNATPKTDVARTTSVTIKKVWNTDPSTPIADSVTVELLRDGSVVETVTLTPENHWQLTCANMPESDAYSIREVNVPKGFTATYSENGFVFTVTNSAALVQTGQLIWPIPVLATAGLVLIAAGAVILRKTRETHA